MERTVRSMAKELAGVFYEEPRRSPGFRRAFPTFKDYLKGHWHQPDGRIKLFTPGWHHHVALARKALTLMLGQPDSVVSPVIKERVFDSLIEDRKRTYQAGNKTVGQVHQIGTEPPNA